MSGSGSLNGKTISHCRILEKPGGGGMSAVCKAEDARLHRFMALRFLRERGTIATLALAVLFAAAFVQPAPAQETNWKEVNNRAVQLYQQGKYAEAIAAAREALQVAETSFGPDHPNTALSLNNLASLYREQGQYAEAEPLLLRALAVLEKLRGPEDLSVANAASNLAVLYQSEGRYADAEPLYKRTLEVREKLLGPQHPDVALSLNNLAELYKGEGNYPEAEPLYKRALAIREKTLGPEHSDVAVSLNNLSSLYQHEGRYAEAEPLCLRALAIREKVQGPNHPDVAISLNNLGSLYHDEGRYRDAEPLYKRALEIREKQLGPEHPYLATSLGNLAALYQDEGQYAAAEEFSKRALAIREKVLGPEHPDVALSLNNLATLYEDEGKYAEAEQLLNRSLEIRKKAFGPEHPVVAISLNNLAHLYAAEGKYADAARDSEQILAIFEKALGPDHPNVATLLNNLAALHHFQGDYPVAEEDYKRAIRISEKALGPEHPDLAGSLDNLASLYEDEGKLDEAEPLYRRALAIREKAFGPEHPDVALSLNNVATLYRYKGNYAEAGRNFKQALAIQQKVLGPDHPDVGVALGNLGMLYSGQGMYREAEPFFDESLENAHKQFEYRFTYMTEKDRLTFLRSKESVFPSYFSFCYTFREKDPNLIGKMYDVALWEKGFISESIAALRSRIAASGDKESLALLDQLTAKKTQLSALLTARPADRQAWRASVEQLERESNDLERKLVERSSVMAEAKKLARVSWRDVQKSLRPSEAAVEILRFDYHDGNKWTGQTRYVALVVTPESKIPSLVDLGDAAAVEKAPINDYRKRVGLEKRASLADKPGFYETFWEPLEPALAGVKRIYFSPDGVLNQVALGVIPAADGRLLLEKYELRIVTNTKNILKHGKRAPGNSAVLIGNPTFRLSETEQRVALQNFHAGQGSEALFAGPVNPGARAETLTRSGTCADLPPGGVLCPLPGTQTEIESVERLLEKRDWRVEPPYVREMALEEVVKAVHHPRVLHVATHGFFRPDRSRSAGTKSQDALPALEDPMLRSGLFFAGADRALREEETPQGIESGILTAYEASTLDLEGTELVVLSACDTGLGEVRTGEGVFGLRRALEQAGAESVMMSMWSVPDRETQELITLFYKHWLSGMEKPEALRRAQLDERAVVIKRYGGDSPYYWGAFVLVGR
jgi:tetratricopeptide (TPR) repeat protein